MDNYRDEKGRFIKGYKQDDVPIEIRIKKANKNKESWKNRDDYIMDLVNQYPKIYNSWRAFMFTEKGKKSGHDERWNSFRTFYEDVISTYKEGLILRRKDRNKKWGKDNFIWIKKEDEYLLDERSIRIEYNGENLTLKEWSEKEQIPYYGIRTRYYRKDKMNYSTEEVIFGRKVKRDSKKVKDFKDASQGMRAKASKMISAYKCRDKKNGFDKVCDITIEWMVENIFKSKCVYCGDTCRLGCDRIDNTKGHTMDNVVPCCIECNQARNNKFTHEEMFTLGKAIAEIKKRRKMI